MKGGIILAATGLAGLAYGGVHTLKLQKIPLSEQLEHVDITTQAGSLYKKYAGQKFMGVRPEGHKEEMFKDTSVHLDHDHPVPVSNFLNAQCMLDPFLRIYYPFSNKLQTFPKSPLVLHLNPSRLFWTPVHPICGSPQRNVAQ